MYLAVKRLADFALSATALLVLSPLMLAVAAIIKATSRGPVIYWSERVGRSNKLFRMPKFRTMNVNAPVVATHLLASPSTWLTPIGGFLRRSSLDELPQLLSVLRGDMSIVGPRPALYNQADLIELRTKRGIDRLTPGLTGWAQVNGRDELAIPDKVVLDEYYMAHLSFRLDCHIVVKTLQHVFRGTGVSH